jgi:uncharacterized DUF497 family protein
MQFNFEWDPQKAKENLRAHRMSFEQAATVFRDPLARTIYDEPHSDAEERWVTLGLTVNGVLAVVVHTFVEVNHDTASIRLISACRATQREQQDYEANG